MLLSNATGARYLEGTLTASTFLGAPLIGIGDSLTVGDPRWTAISDFADWLGSIVGTSAPLVGVSTDVAGDLPQLRACLAMQTRFYAPDGLRPFVWRGDSGAPVTYPVAGPIICLPSDEAHRENTRLLAAGESGAYIRTRSSNIYGIGNFACGPDVDPDVRLTPPVYDVVPSVLVPTLRRLFNLWRGFGGPIQKSSYATLLALEGTRPGISTRVHPALVPYIVLTI